MKILAVSTWFPVPPDNGSKARTYNLLSRIGAEHSLDLISLSQCGRDVTHLGEVQRFCRRVAVLPEPQFRPEAVGTWLGFLSPTPRYFQAHHSREMESLAKYWAAREQYDVAIAVTLGAAPYVAKLDVPYKVLDEHNVESQVIKRQCENEQSPLRKLRYAPTWRKAERFERKLARKFNAITVVSDCEKDLMNRLLRNGHTRRVHVVANGVDPGYLEYRRPVQEHGLLAFTGALSYQPNFDGAACLCREILPAVRTRFSHARVRLTGSLEGVDISGLQGMPGVEFTGYLEDIRPVVASASVLVVPLRFGGGTRLKILEAMALGTPVVSTPIGAEGLDVVDGTHILLGETAAEMSDQVTRILANPSLAERISKNARALVKERYQWPMIAEKFRRVLVNREQEGNS